MKLNISLNNQSVTDLLSLIKERTGKDAKQKTLLSVLMNLPVNEITVNDDTVCIKLKLLPDITARYRIEPGRIVLYDYSYGKVTMVAGVLGKILGNKLDQAGVSVGEKEIVIKV